MSIVIYPVFFDNERRLKMARLKYVDVNDLTSVITDVIKNRREEVRYVDSIGKDYIDFSFYKSDTWNKNILYYSKKNAHGGCEKDDFLANVIKYSATNDNCKIRYKQDGNYVYVLPWKTIYVNNPNHKLYGTLWDVTDENNPVLMVGAMPLSELGL